MIKPKKRPGSGLQKTTRRTSNANLGYAYSMKLSKRSKKEKEDAKKVTNILLQGIKK
tara:strand:- start:299 stop:469 length:171 start_codon:yes stop_codon:yes gene_type:complete